jgi:hexosaminidase
MKTSVYVVILSILLGTAVLFVGCGNKSDSKSLTDGISLIPRPQFLKKNEGTFLVNKDTFIAYNFSIDELKGIANYLKGQLKRAMDFTLFSGEVKPDTVGNYIQFQLVKETDLGNEGYKLWVDSDKIKIEANTPRGIFYGVQTLLQLMPVEIRSARFEDNVIWGIPAVEIKDVPRYKWRGMHLDVARHFFSKEVVKQYIDHLAMYKLNMFHWHLTEDQGWRIAVEKYPKLAEISAYRKESWGDGKPHGGIYSREDIEEVVAYAGSRYVTIVPEIELPGHSKAALAAYPELSCTGGPFEVETHWGIFEDIYCAGNEKTFEFLENVLAEVIELFPGEYIHIGGDEAPKARWKKCPKCQARIEAEGLKNEHELQSYFIRRIEKFLNARGKRLIGWDEILEGGLAPNATVMSWRGMEGGIAAAKENHDVVMTPTSHCYFDYYQGHSDYEPRAIGGNLPLSKVYMLEPTPEGLTPQQEKHILGAQANLWTEYIEKQNYLEYMTFPRLAALAEVVWSPKELRNWDHFQERMFYHFQMYKKIHVNFATAAMFVTPKATFSTDPEPQVVLELSTEFKNLDIRYTLDGNDPTTNSDLYEKPLIITNSTVVKALAFQENNRVPLSFVMKYAVNLHKAFAKKITVANPPENWNLDDKEGGLTNGIRGSRNYYDGQWQGTKEADFEAVVELDNVAAVNKISAGFIAKPGASVFFPVKIEFYVSQDGGRYSKVGELTPEPPEDNNEIIKKDFSVDCPGTNAKYIKIIARNMGKTPEWHARPGEGAWIFIDEIIVE